MSLISAAVCVGVMSVMSTLETRAVWAMAGRGNLQHGMNFRFVAHLEFDNRATRQRPGSTVKPQSTVGARSTSS